MAPQKPLSLSILLFFSFLPFFIILSFGNVIAAGNVLNLLGAVTYNAEELNVWWRTNWIDWKHFCTSFFITIFSWNTASFLMLLRVWYSLWSVEHKNVGNLQNWYMTRKWWISLVWCHSNMIFRSLSSGIQFWLSNHESPNGKPCSTDLSSSCGGHLGFCHGI